MSNVQLFAAPWTVAHQNVAPLPMGFSRQEYRVGSHALLHWSGLPFPPPGNLPDPGIEPASHVSSLVRRIPYYRHDLGKKQGPILQSEGSQKEKDESCILMYIYGIKKHGTEDPRCRAARETQM